MFQITSFIMSELKAKDIRKNYFVILNQRPSEIICVEYSKCKQTIIHLQGIDLINLNKYNWIGLKEHRFIQFEPIKMYYQIIHVENNDIECLDENLSTKKFNFNCEDEIKTQIINLIEDNTLEIEILFAPTEKNNNIQIDYRVVSFEIID